MEEGKFDEILKKKLGEYVQPGFDAYALEGLHHKLAEVPAQSLHLHSRFESMAAVLSFLVGLVLVWSHWAVVSQQMSQLRAENQELKIRVDSLMHHSPQWLAIPSREGTAGGKQQHSIGLLSPTFLNPPLLLSFYRSNSQSGTTQGLVYPGRFPSRFPGAPFFERLPGMVVVLKGRQYLALHPSQARLPELSKKFPPAIFVQNSGQTHPGNRKKIPLVLPPPSTVPLSRYTLTALKNHYRQGVSIRMGPTASLLFRTRAPGESGPALGAGGFAEFLFSPSLGLETGLIYSVRNMTLDEAAELAGVHLPFVNHSLGPLEQVEIDSRMLELPVTLKYHLPVNESLQMVGGIGFSAYFYTNQEFEYSYGIPGGGNSQEASIIADYAFNRLRVYPASLAVMGGVSKQLQNGKALETAFLYQRGVGTLGREKISSDFLGLRTVYWFTLR